MDKPLLASQPHHLGDVIPQLNQLAKVFGWQVTEL